ncbi:hypothetical protein [Streptomyces sp. NPDC087859]|uniref:hypothetical protein n=1 Tax=Streptomyces sp. NPDC087859 TaxID=3365812 RepID=UPI003807856C
MAELTALYTSAQQRLSRLEIARETVTAILDETMGVLTVRSCRPSLDTMVLPTACQDLIEVIADAGRQMRAIRAAVENEEAGGTR